MTKVLPGAITSFTTHDVRFPTDVWGDGTDAQNQSCNHSLAYVEIKTSTGLVGHGMSFTIGHGNDLVCRAIEHICQRLVNKDVAEFWDNMGAFWNFLVQDPQMRWVGPEKGLIHLATAAVDNAIWDLWAKFEKKPLWQLVADMSPEDFVKSMALKYVADTLPEDEALRLVTQWKKGQADRVDNVKNLGYPAYTTSAGWLGYSNDKVKRLVLEALGKGFNHIKLKVGVDRDNDLKRCQMVRELIDNPENCKNVHVDPAGLEGKNAGPTGCVLMVDANQVWDVPTAIDYMKHLAPTKPWFIEEPTAPDDVLGHRRIKDALAPLGIKVATGEHTHNRMAFKNFFEMEAMDVCQLDAVRLGGFSEVLTVLVLAKKFGVPCLPHSGAVGLMNYHANQVHVALIDYLCVSQHMEQNVLEYVDHGLVHEPFVYPVGPVNKRGRYNVPLNPECGASIELQDKYISIFSYPDGKYWDARAKGGDPENVKFD